ncbi:MAG: phosphatase PAP2 family protein [Bacteroidales bacterium]|nr:phosphatase PAP2 family protein [Bacteroidales bacterium]
MANYISYIFNPLIMPTLGIFILFNSGSIIDFTSFEVKRAVYIITLLGTFALPLSFIPLFLYNKVINTVMIQERTERIIPLLITSVTYLVAYFVAAKIPVALIVKKFILSTALSVFIICIITIKWKISVHMASIGGVVGLIMSLIIRLNLDLLPYLMVALFIAGLMASSRLRLNAHKPLEVYAGFLLGGATVCVTLNVL